MCAIQSLFQLLNFLYNMKIAIGYMSMNTA